MAFINSYRKNNSLDYTDLFICFLCDKNSVAILEKTRGNMLHLLDCNGIFIGFFCDKNSLINYTILVTKKNV